MEKGGSFWSEGKGLQYSLKDRRSRRLVFYILVCLLVFCFCFVVWNFGRFSLFDVSELYVTWLIFWGSRFAYAVSCVWIINITETLHQCSIKDFDLRTLGFPCKIRALSVQGNFFHNRLGRKRPNCKEAIVFPHPQDNFISIIRPEGLELGHKIDPHQ